MAARASKQGLLGALHRPVSTTAAEGYRFDHRGAASFQSNHPCRWYQPAVAIIGSVHPRLGPQCHGHRPATCFQSVATPWIGAGSGGGNPHRIQTMIEDELTRCPFDGEVRVVRYSNLLANRRVNSRGGSVGF
jgi:hypothetical protein